MAVVGWEWILWVCLGPSLFSRFQTVVGLEWVAIMAIVATLLIVTVIKMGNDITKKTSKQILQEIIVRSKAQRS